jgi:hypothetical protein
MGTADHRGRIEDGSADCNVFEPLTRALVEDLSPYAQTAISEIVPQPFSLVQPTMNRPTVPPDGNAEERWYYAVQSWSRGGFPAPSTGNR